MEKRERLGSRLGFIMLSAGSAIGCGNVWKFPYLTGENGGGAFVLLYIIFLVLMGLPVMVMEFSIGRASQKSPVKMLPALEKKGTHWGAYGAVALGGCIFLMSFYTTVAGKFLDYFVNFATGKFASATVADSKAFSAAIDANPVECLVYMAIICVAGFAIISFSINGGLERITKYMMMVLLVLMLALTVNSLTLSGAAEGLDFYLTPDFTNITWDTVSAAMCQSFFTLSLGIGSMAVFGSYIGKEKSLMGESIIVIALDTFVAIIAGLVIFPATSTFGIAADSGPSLVFITLPAVFGSMKAGRLWGTLFFLFMTFAAFTTVLAVFESILAMVRELTGWTRRKGSIICCVGMILVSIPAALAGSVLKNFTIFGKSVDTWEDFMVNNLLIPVGCLIFVLFCGWKFGWGWDNFLGEANTGNGVKFPKWAKPYVKFVLPVVIALVGEIGIVSFFN